MPLSLPFGAAQAPAAVRVPTIEGNFGSLDADTLRERMVRLTVDQRSVPGVNSVELLLPAGGERPDLAPGDAVALSIGYGDGENTVVFTGVVDTVAPSISGAVRATATDGGAALAALRLERSYESMSAADIVQDLLSEAGVSAGTVEAGPSLPFFVVGHGRSVLAWIEALARASGFIALVDGEGELQFGPPASGSPAAGFTYGQDILSLSVRDRAPLVAATTVVGEGAAGSEGQEAWAWLLKDPSPVTGEAGDGSPARIRSDGALRTSDGATGAAEGWVAASSRAAATGELRVPGALEAAPGTSVEIADTPGGSLDGAYLVLAARHRMDARGLVTTLRVSGPDGGGGGLPGGLL